MKQKDGILFSGLLFIFIIIAQLVVGFILALFLVPNAFFMMANKAVYFDGVLLGIIAAAFAVACAAVFLILGGKKNGGYPELLEQEIKGRRRLIALLCFSLLYVAFSIPVYVLASEDGLKFFFMVTLGQALGVLLPAVLYMIIFKMRPAHVRLKKINVLEILACVVAIVCLYPVIALLNGLWLSLLMMIGIEPTTPVSVDTGSLIANIISICVFPAIFEEFAFRGVIMNEIAPYGRKKAIVLTGFAFALMHLQLEGLPTHLVLSFVLCALVYYSGTLWTGIVAHFTFNAVSVLLKHFEETSTAGPVIGMFESLPGLIAMSLIGLFIALPLLITVARRGRKRGRIEALEPSAAPAYPQYPQYTQYAPPVEAAPETAASVSASSYILSPDTSVPEPVPAVSQAHNAPPSEPAPSYQAGAYYGYFVPQKPQKPKPPHGFASYLPIGGGIAILSAIYIFITMLQLLLPI